MATTSLPQTLPLRTLPSRRSGGPRDIAPIEDSEPLSRAIRTPFIVGSAVSGVLVGGFILWGALAPLAGGAVAAGTISPDGSRRTVQHLEGGIIASLRVRDGDVVHAGDPLVILDNLQPAAAYEALLNQQQTLAATYARLSSEHQDRDRVVFPPELTAAPSPALRTIIEGQQRIFASRRSTHVAKRGILRQRIEQFGQQIAALEAQAASARRQLVLVADELEGKEQLRKKEIISKPDLLRLQRTQAEIEGRLGEYLGTISRVRQQIGETEMQLLALEAERVDQVATQLDQTRAELATVTERLLASKDILTRTSVTAPIGGTVVGLRFKTEGGVIQKGEPILDIVPAEEILLIDARVAPTDIDAVRPGLSAQVHLTAYSSRGLPRINGVVRTVSADRLVDPTTNQPYYLARVEVQRAELKRIDPKLELIAGMPAEVLIVTGERTMIQYLLEPLLRAFWRSFREV